jgi:two-component system sensor histidine kinase ChvG
MPRTRWLRSIRLQAVALAVILVALPALIFAVLGNADTERRHLVLSAVTQTGDAIAAGLGPVLHDLRPADIGTLAGALSRFTAPDRSIKVLLRPTNATADQSFFFVAIEPPISPEQTQQERQQLLDLGILPQLAQGCVARFLRGGNASVLGNGAEVLTSVTSVQGAAGCWVIVIATAEQHLLGAIQAPPYWARQEVRVAMAIYGLMACLIVAIFAGVWRSLLRFRRLALSSAQQPGFASMTDIPELASLASAFDGMVQRIRRSADMLRQAAEDNAHAFKGPIGTIRQAIDRPMRNCSSRDPVLRRSLQTVSAALDRLDGLVRSARTLDSAAAELLEPPRVSVDLSALVRGFTDSYATAGTARQVHLDAHVTEGIVVTAQPETLETILETLVDNAISFSPAGGSVAVRLDVDGDHAIMAVEDEGPGIAEDTSDRIFDRYYTYRPTDPSSPDHTAGTPHFGIGLWLARQNALSIGGEIAAINREPGGLRVTVVLPIVTP